jgi:hypothetical protein
MRLISLLLLLLAAPAGALTIQIDSVSLGAGNPADSTAQTLIASDSVPDVAGGPYAEADARWAGTLYADDGSASATGNWSLTFTVVANPGVVYDVLIQEELAGAFTFFDDSIGGATGSIGELTSTLDGLPNPLLTMPVGVDGTATSATTGSVSFQRGALLNLDNLVGTQTFTLAFTFDIDAQSTNDQIAVQLGLSGPGSNAAAAYPGISGRDAAGDGHFVRLQTRVELAPVPEPGTFALLSLGLVGIGIRRMRCRR